MSFDNKLSDIQVKIAEIYQPEVFISLICKTNLTFWTYMLKRICFYQKIIDCSTPIF